MFDSNAVFDNPVTTVDQVIRSAFGIFLAQWKTFIVIAFGKVISISLLLFLFMLALSAWVGSAFEAFSKCAFTGDYHARNLADHLTGVPSSGYRLLYESSFSDFDVHFDGDNFDVHFDGDDFDVHFDGDTDTDPTQCFQTAIELLMNNSAVFGILLTFLPSFILVSSIFDGTMVHALAHTHIGHLPSISNSFQYGIKRMCGLLTFSGLYTSIAFIGGFLTIGIPIIIRLDDPNSAKANPGFIFLCFVLFIIFLFVFSTTMTAGIPSIVVEGHSGISAIPRSYYLCKDSICFIFCSNFCFALLVFITNAIFNSLLGFIPVLLTITSFAISTVSSILGVAISVVLYISLRTRSEQLTREKMAEELGDCIATPMNCKYEAA